MKSLENRLSSLKAQVKVEKEILAHEGDDSVSTKIDAVHMAELRQEMAERSYAAALEFVASARREAIQQSRYLMVLAEPLEGDAWAEPPILRSVLTVFTILIVLVIYCEYGNFYD